MIHPREWRTREGASFAAALLDAQVEHVARCGAPATVAELARRIGNTPQYACRLAQRLTREGYMEQREGSALYWPIRDADGVSLS